MQDLPRWVKVVGARRSTSGRYVLIRFEGIGDPPTHRCSRQPFANVTRAMFGEQLAARKRSPMRSQKRARKLNSISERPRARPPHRDAPIARNWRSLFAKRPPYARASSFRVRRAHNERSRAWVRATKKFHARRPAHVRLRVGERERKERSERRALLFFPPLVRA